MPGFTLKPYDEMFKSTEPLEEKNTQIPTVKIDKLVKFKNHPFKPYEGDKLQDLADSIKEHGILMPILVRPIESDQYDYEIIAGHNRVSASKLAGLEEIPATIKAMDDDTAIIYMVETNFKQRQNMLPSEKAFAYKIQLEALNRQGKRDFGPTSPEVPRSRDEVAIANNESGRQIQRYIRLTNLIPDLLDLVDEEKMPLYSGVNVSFLNEKQQQILTDVLENNKVKPTIQATEILKQEKDTELNYNKILNILGGNKPKQSKKTKPIILSKPTKINLDLKPVKHLFDSMEIEETELQKIIIEGIDLYFKQNISN